MIHLRALGDIVSICGDEDNAWTYVVTWATCEACMEKLCSQKI